LNDTLARGIEQVAKCHGEFKTTNNSTKKWFRAALRDPNKYLSG